jgi:hypothetical protein
MQGEDAVGILAVPIWLAGTAAAVFVVAILLERLGDLQGVEVFVMIHSWLPYPKGGVFERAELLAKRKPGNPHPFADPASFAEYVQRNEANAARTLEEEKKKAGIVQ